MNIADPPIALSPDLVVSADKEIQAACLHLTRAICRLAQPQCESVQLVHRAAYQAHRLATFLLALRAGLPEDAARHADWLRKFGSEEAAAAVTTIEGAE